MTSSDVQAPADADSQEAEQPCVRTLLALQPLSDTSNVRLLNHDTQDANVS